MKGFPIKTINLECYYQKKKVLSNININIEKGKFYCIIGPNGSGKTTLLKSILGLIKVGDNAIFIYDKDLNLYKPKELARCLSYVPQDTNIEFNFNVHDIVLMGRFSYLNMFQTSTSEDMKFCKNAMLITNTWDLRNKNINEISGGERQRMLIARAICQDSSVLLLDEPVSNLDLKHQLEILDNVKVLVENGMTVVAVLHDLNLAISYCDSLLILNQGSVAYEGKPYDIINSEVLYDVFKVKTHIVENPLNKRPYILPYI